jgi:hypothetical protein
VEDSSAKGEIEEQSKKAAKLGEIKVEVHRVEQRGLSSQSRTPPPTGILTLSEKALKGKELSHVTTYDMIWTIDIYSEKANNVHM